MKPEKFLIKQAKKLNKTIVYPEAALSDRIVRAAKIVAKKEIAKVILIADEGQMAIRFKKLENITIINPKTSHLTQELAKKLYNLRKEKGLKEKQAQELILDPFYFATMLVNEGYADGMVAGAEVSTASTLKPALQIIRAKDEIASSSMLFFGKNKNIELPLILADPGINPNPTSQQLAVIAHQTTQTVKGFFSQIEPRIAFLSYSTKGSANGEMVEKISQATSVFKQNHPNILADGELQLDSALVPYVAKKKCPLSPVAGRANVLIVPDLNVGNIVYKSMQYFGNLTAIGPIIQGLNKPVNDLSRGCSVKDIVVLTAVTVLQAGRVQEEEVN